MDTKYFILFRNIDYAKTIKNVLYGKICSTESELFGISPNENDVFLIDAHFGGQMSRLNGMNILKKYLSIYRNTRFSVRVYSWFDTEYIARNHLDKSYILKLPNVKYMRFPLQFLKSNKL